jgi:hypothetical protein
MALVAAVVALAATWSVITPWNAPVWPLLMFVPVPALVWWVTAGTGAGLRLGAAVVVVIVVVATVAVWASPLPGRLRFGGTLDELEQTAVVVLADSPSPAEACGPPPPLDYGVLGVPTEVCVVIYALGVATVSMGGTPPGDGVDDADDQGDGSVTEREVRQVRFDWTPASSVVATRSLVFEGGVAQPPAGRCVRQVDGRWWAWSLPDGGCPRGSVPSSG